ncbi:aldo/keto reductase [Hyphomonas sp.]|uniref:aldo/keto reductase n=1 Tax=Hyphomonas sp. TaxID=87 RepID=UPI0032EF207F
MLQVPPRIRADLPRFGLGAAGLGNLYTAVSDAEANEALAVAEESGFNLVDTAPFYGHGLSEQRIGAFLARGNWRPSLSTKVGRVLDPAGTRAIPDNGFASPEPFIPRFDYSADGIRSAFCGSQERLGVEAVEVLLLHDIGRATHGNAHDRLLRQALDEALPEMAKMKAEGLTTWIGLGVNETEVCEDILCHCDLDVLLIAGRYTLLEHEASIGFLDTCHASGIKVLIGGAFNSGLLVASANEPLHYDYKSAPQWAIDRAAEFRQVCAKFEVPVPAVALQFCAAHPAVASVLPGARTGKQVRQIADWASLKIDPALWDSLRDAHLISAYAPVPS